LHKPVTEKNDIAANKTAFTVIHYEESLSPFESFHN